MRHMFSSLRANQRGFLMPALISFIIASTIFGGAVLTVILTNFFVIGNNIKSQQAFNIAEAGVNYYLWHLSHNGKDYQDGTGAPSSPDPILGYGPYEHDYIDDNGVNQGTFTLWLKPQSTGSTIVTVRAIGAIRNSNITRTVEAKIGATSFASYGVLSDTALWFGDTESANGPIFSNQGIRIDGANTGTVSAANTTYVPSSSLGGNGSSSHPGVWCSTSVVTPVNCSTRNKSTWSYPQSSVDFNQVSGSLCDMKKVAFADYSSTQSYATLANACSQVPTTRTNAYIPQRGSSFSTTKGYLIQLNSNNTYNLYNVNAENDQLTPYTSALTLASVATNIAIPPSGVIYTEDNVWVRTNTTFTGRVSIAAGRLATTKSASITIADDILYTAKDGSDAIGLVAEQDILIAPYAPPASGSFNFEVDAAALAQSGSVLSPLYYKSNTSKCTRGWIGSNQTLTYYGSVASRQSWTWTWLVGGACGDAVYDSASGYRISGIKHNTSSYDYNLLYAPPPSFPITGGYSILSWREVLTKP